MTIFKAFLKVLNKNKFIVITYTAILVLFGAFNMQTSNNSIGYISAKPDILIINKDENKGLTKNLISYIENNSNKVEVESNENSINDALFYRDVNYIIYIPANFRKDFLEGNNPQIKIKKTGDYQSSLANMLLERYLKVASTYSKIIKDENLLIKNINDTLKDETEVTINSIVDKNALNKAAYYYNFANYSILAGCVYIICIILSNFNNNMIRKRTIISSTNNKSFNRILLISNSLFAIILWLFYVILSFILVGEIMFTISGLFYIFNSLIFSICALTLAFLIGNISNNKNALNGIVNVIALGSSFLCGAFVPTEYLPDIVLKIAHIFPSYYFINTNNLLTKIEKFNFNSLRPVLINTIIIILFTIIFIVLTNIISKRKNKLS